MTTLLFTHPVCLEHDTGPHHPECPDRLKAVLRALEGEEFSLLLHHEMAPHATTEQILRAHPMHHYDFIMECIPNSDAHQHIDADTVVSRNSGEAALRAAGAVVAAVDAVAKGECRNAFAAVRPPGHHAEYDAAGGFCLFNNAAIGAYHARAVHGLQKVAVIDFDVHHGNGTQHIFYEDPNMFYASTHEDGSYPGTGLAEETGVANNILNVPLPTGSTSDPFRMAMSDIILPAVRDFKPDLIIISAGFDAHAADPMAHLRLRTDDFSWVTHEILHVAKDVCGDRVVSTLEGGYDIPALAASCQAHVRALLGS